MTKTNTKTPALLKLRRILRRNLNISSTPKPLPPYDKALIDRAYKNFVEAYDVVKDEDSKVI